MKPFQHISVVPGSLSGRAANSSVCAQGLPSSSLQGLLQEKHLHAKPLLIKPDPALTEGLPAAQKEQKMLLSHLGLNYREQEWGLK